MKPKKGSSNDSPKAPLKRTQIHGIRSSEKYIIIETYENIKKTWPPNLGFYSTKVAQKTATVLGVSVSSVYRVLRENKAEGRPKSPVQTRNRLTAYTKLKEKDKKRILEIFKEIECRDKEVYFQKIFKEINEDKSLPVYSTTTLRRLLTHLGLKCAKKRSKNTDVSESFESSENIS